MDKALRKRLAIIGTSSALLAACAPSVNKEDMAKASEGFVVEDTNKLFVVDCLLPGQVRKLGSQMTYLSARRPIRTTAADCEVRGGEYVAYDRANYASALKIWLPKAKEGDATAQLYVGEIFEKGLGQQTDYQAAAQWYRKAADQGNSQAQINLGQLYEKGLGVGKDPNTALQWYRKASGLDSADLKFASAIDPSNAAQSATNGASSASTATSTEMERLRREAESSRQEAEQLRSQLRSTQQQMTDQQEELRRAQDELEAARNKLLQEKSVSTKADDPELRALEAELKQKESALRNQQTKVNSMAAALSKERASVKRELESARRSRAGSGTANGDAPAAQSELSGLENSLNDKIADYQKNSGELTEWLTGSGGTGVSREKIDERKKALQTQAKEIAQLRERIEQQGRKLASAEKSQTLAANGGPAIEIIDPPLTMTRGMPSIPMGSSDASREIVGKIQSPVGLSSLRLNDQALAVDSAGVFRTQVKRQQGETPLKFVATDKKNRSTDLLVRLIGEAEQPEPSAFPASKTSAGPIAGDVSFGQFYALVIGNNDYGAFPQLKTAINDAKSVDLLLRERYGFKTKLLLNANRHAIMTALNEINKKLTDQDNLIIYYAGHGEIDTRTQSAYWLPTDAEAGNSANWISSQSITEFLSIMPAKHVMVVADSCYSGALTGSAVAKLPDGMDEAKRNRWLKVMNTRKARTVLTSGGVQPVMDEGGGDHSVFAKAFLNVLRSNKRVLEDYDVFRDVSNQVRSASARSGFTQSPQYAPLQHAGHEGSPFFFVPEA